jgi:creatine kinase
MAIRRQYSAKDEFPNLSKHHNILSKVLTLDMYERLSSLTSNSGYTLDKCIQTGVDNPGTRKDGHSIVGCVAGDEDCYSAFSELFDVLINHIHGPYPTTARQDVRLSVTDIEYDDDTFDPAYVLGYQIQVKRNLHGYSLSPLCSRSERRSVEKVASSILESFEGSLVGEYHTLKSLTGAEREELRSHTLLFDRPTATTWTHAQIARDWPDGRGIWKSHAHNMAVWVNEVDHLQFNMTGSMENLKEVFEFLVLVMKQFERGLTARKRSFMWNDHHGYLNVCPSNIGTGMSVQFAIRLDESIIKNQRFSEVLSSLNLSIQEDQEMEGGVWLTFKKKLGVTEFDVFKTIITGATGLIGIQKSLESGQYEVDTVIEHFFNPPQEEEVPDNLQTHVSPPTRGRTEQTRRTESRGVGKNMSQGRIKVVSQKT